MASSSSFSPLIALEVAAKFDLRDLPPDFYANPYPYYEALRDFEPVRSMPDGTWFLTRYEDILPVYRDHKTFSSSKKIEFGLKFGPSPLLQHHTTSLVFSDPPLHTRVRKAIVGALSQRHIAAMEPALAALVDRLLDSMASRREVDLIDDFAAAIPVEVIGNLLGVPHDERGALRQWSLDILGALEPVLTQERGDNGNRAVEEMLVYLKGLVDDRRRALRNPETDVLTRLILGEGEADAGGEGERLSENELLHQCIFLLNAGHETTTNLIGNALHALTQWPDERAALAMAPHAESQLLKSAVEEFLRYESSNQLGNRIAMQEVKIGRFRLPAGSLITIGIGAANRDPEQFPEPDVLKLDRDPNRHVAFGSGIHACAGMNLARLEARVALSRFLRRFPDYALRGAPVRGGRARFRGFLHLPATVEPR